MPRINPFPAGVKPTLPFAVDGSTGNVSVGAGTNAAAVVALAADAGRGHVISRVFWSYKGSTTPTGRLQVLAGAAVYFDVDVAGQGPGEVTFDPPLLLPAGSSAQVSLDAGGSGVTGKVNVVAWTLD